MFFKSTWDFHQKCLIILYYKQSLNKLPKVEILSEYFSDNNKIKLKISNKEISTRSDYKLNNIL